MFHVNQEHTDNNLLSYLQCKALCELVVIDFSGQTVGHIFKSQAFWESVLTDVSGQLIK
jgi:hypothetical protein